MNRTRPASTPTIVTHSEAKRRLINDARAFWEPRAGRRVGDEDARQIAENVVGFFDLLRRWDAEEKEAAPAAEKGVRDKSRN